MDATGVSADQACTAFWSGFSAWSGPYRCWRMDMWAARGTPRHESHARKRWARATGPRPAPWSEAGALSEAEAPALRLERCALPGGGEAGEGTPAPEQNERLEQRRAHRAPRHCQADRRLCLSKVADAGDFTGG